MTTNKPEVAGFISEVGIKNLREDEYTGDWTLYAGPVRNSTTPLIRLSDYEALQAEYEKLRACLAETAGVAVTMLYESHKADTLKEFDVTELARMVDYTKHLADANVQVEKVYRKAWNMAQGCAGAD